MYVSVCLCVSCWCVPQPQSQSECNAFPCNVLHLTAKPYPLWQHHLSAIFKVNIITGFLLARQASKCRLCLCLTLSLSLVRFPVFPLLTMSVGIANIAPAGPCGDWAPVSADNIGAIEWPTGSGCEDALLPCSSSLCISCLHCTCLSTRCYIPPSELS